nr:hypothetical protein [Pseudomonas sp. LPH1]
MRKLRPLPKYMRPGGFFDISSVWGNIKSIILVLLGAFAIWNFHYFSFWLDSVLGLEHTPATEGMVRVRRFWAGILGGAGLFVGIAKILWLYWYRKQAVKSAEGQWYDNASLSKEDLYADGGNNISERKEE